MVWASLFKVSLEVVHGRLPMTLVVAYGSRGARHARAARLLAIADVIIGCGGGLLKTLHGPLPAALGTLLGVYLWSLSQIE
jgi:hypothetical protein